MERERTTKFCHGIAEDVINFISGEIMDDPDKKVVADLRSCH
jgi:hypothetical protein